MAKYVCLSDQHATVAQSHSPLTWPIDVCGLMLGIWIFRLGSGGGVSAKSWVKKCCNNFFSVMAGKYIRNGVTSAVFGSLCPLVLGDLWERPVF